ncbi:hypothetical protein ACL07V_34440 [Streptomyces sp. MB22_4]|uniref:hypothetical protein n=1 Tax=Streptomyces sp. MB22_4 TaxID=3383120 RepID=UPI0039A01C96
MRTDALPLADGGGLLWRVPRQFHHPLIHVLPAAGAVTAASSEYADFAVVSGVVLVNALIGFVQKPQAETAMEDRRAVPAVHPAPGA